MRILAWPPELPASIHLTAFPGSFDTWVPDITELADAGPRRGVLRGRGGVPGNRRGRWIAPVTRRKRHGDHRISGRHHARAAACRGPASLPGRSAAGHALAPAR